VIASLELKHTSTVAVLLPGLVHEQLTQSTACGSGISLACCTAASLQELALPQHPPHAPLLLLLLLLQGAGTIAHLTHHFYPERTLHGWELDPAVVAVAQQHMGLRDLEQAGCLVCVYTCV
jgi:hypothetical protein